MRTVSFAVAPRQAVAAVTPTVMIMMALTQPQHHLQQQKQRP